MSLHRPIFLFAFANDKEGSLRLGEEERIARELLTTPHIEPSIQYMNLGHTSLDDIFLSFNRYHNQIALLHYGVHSDSQFLNLTDQNARASTLSTLMGLQKNLQLVFLNGCNNKGQVEELQNHKVKAIIATSVLIPDEKALAFCRQFYQALAGGGQEKKSIQEAFDTAKAYVQNETYQADDQQRGIAIADEEEEKASDFEWSLYLLDDHQADWSIPSPLQVPEDANFTKEVDLSHRDDQNQLLLELVYGLGEDDIGLPVYQPQLKVLKDQFETKQGDSDYFDDLRDALFDAFPSVLSIQLKDLFTYPEGVTQGRLRLKELNEVYLTLGRLINAIALSTLWDAAFDPDTLQPKDGFLIPEECKRDILAFLNPSDPLAALQFDYFWLVGTVNRIFKDPQNKSFEPYVPELASLFSSLEEEAPYYEAYRFLEQNLRHRLIAGNIATAEVEALCEEGEGYLGLLLQKFSFLSQYQLITVKDVSVYQPRQAPAPIFYHNQFTLKGVESVDQVNNYTMLDRSKAINNNSLYLAKDFRQEEQPLNLSPFLIDENVFKAKSNIHLPKIHFFSGMEEQAAVHYVHAEVPESSVSIRKMASPNSDKFRRKTKSSEKYVFEYYTQQDGQRTQTANPDERNYRQKDLKTLFDQLTLFKKALGI